MAKPLTLLERRTLHLAARKGGVVVVPRRKRKDDRAVTTATANRVVLAGWATISSDVLLITKAGRSKLNEPLPPPPETYLRVRDGVTTRVDQAVSRRDEPSVMPPPDPRWFERAEAHRRRDREDANAARLSGLTHPDERLRELRLLAAQQGVDIRDDLRQAEHIARRIERKLSERAA